MAIDKSSHRVVTESDTALGRRVIVFDLFGVLFSRGLTHSLDDLTAILNRSEADIARAYRRQELEFDAGSIDEEEFWARINRDLGTSVKVSQLTDAVISAYEISEHTKALVDYLKAHHSVLVYSNYRQEWFERLNQRFQVARLFEKVFISSVTGVLKPHSKVFDLVQYATNAERSLIALVDDEPLNVQAAEKWGAHGVLFTSPYEAEVALRAKLAFKYPAYASEYVGIFLKAANGALLLQRRPIGRGIANPGKLSVFGGKSRRLESPLASAVRQLREEVDLRLEPGRFRHVCELGWPSKKGSWERCNYYVVDDVAVDDLRVASGSCEVKWPADAIKQEMTQLARFVLERHLMQQQRSTSAATR